MVSQELRAFRKENLPAYAGVAAVFLVLSAGLAAAAEAVFPARPTFGGFFVLALVGVMLGMSIMFGASLLNLRKLRPGFERLAAGSREPNIPPVWCPVLTTATQAALRLSERVHQGRPEGGD